MGSKVGHQVATIANVTNMSTRLHHIAFIGIIVDIELVSSSARVTSVKSAKGFVLSENHSDPKTPGSDKNKINFS